MVTIKKKLEMVTDTPKVSVSEILELIPESFIQKLATDLVVDKWAKKFTANAIFKLVLFSTLSSERLSLRVMEEKSSDPIFKSMVPALAEDKVTWGGIRDRLSKVDPIFFQRLYEYVYKMASDKYGSESLSKLHIKRYDSTMIATYAHLLSGMKVGNTSKNKTQAKFTTELKDDFLIKMTFHQDQPHLSEERALKEAVEKEASKDKNEVAVFDKGLKSRKTFGEFDDAQIQFVGRLNEGNRYEFIRTHSTNDPKLAPQELVEQEEQEDDLLEFVQDSIVLLYESSHKTHPKEFRMIQYQLKKTGKAIFFVTNVLDIEASTIAEIYRKRWDIEVLFRFMKQEMNLTHFVCNDPNAIAIMMYCNMIAAMLVLIYKQQNNIRSYKIAKIRFFKELEYSILIDIVDDPTAIKYLKQLMIKYVNRR